MRVSQLPPPLTVEQQVERDRVQAENDERKIRESRKNTWAEFCAWRGTRYANATLSGFEVARDEAVAKQQRDALDALAGYISELPRNVADGRGIVLYGPKGTGKDHLMSAVLRVAVLSHGIDVKWANGMDLFGEFRDLIDGEANESKFVKSLASPSILAISDPVPPVGNLTGWQMSQLFRVIDMRYRNMKPIFVTMNATGAGDAESRMSGQIVDRLRDGALVVQCNWPSYRKAK